MKTQAPSRHLINQEVSKDLALRSQGQEDQKIKAVLCSEYEANLGYIKT